MNMKRKAATAIVAGIAIVPLGTSIALATSTPYYTNCDAVRAAGKAPLLKDQPGYRPALDRDGDGIACEDTTSPTTKAPTPPTTSMPTTPTTVKVPTTVATVPANAAEPVKAKPGFTG